MTGLAEATANVSPHVTAAVLLLSRSMSEPLGLPSAGVDEILVATGAKRSRAYELRAELAALLPALQRPPGRPAAPPEAEPDGSEAQPVTSAVLGFVMGQPGSVHGGRTRGHYSDGFRHFIVGLRDEHAAMALEHFASAAHLPLGTVKDWLSTPLLPTEATPLEPIVPPPEAPEGSGIAAHIQTVVTTWQTWSGTFSDFSDYVRKHCRVPMGQTAIGTILEAHGVRIPRRRPGRSPDEKAQKGTFRTYFPGAQWEGDGMIFAMELDQVRFTFNVEPMVDSYSAGFVGLASLRDAEDSQAVTEAFADGVATTGQAPLAVVLDNRGSNHTPEVEAAVGETLIIRATPARGQNKPHVEGGFGLFAQTVPAVVINTQCEPREVARQIGTIAATIFFRIMNHRPRRDRGGRSRVDLYGDKPTPEEIQAALTELKERQRRQLLAQQTAHARLRPEVLALLEDTFRRLGIDDPTGNERRAVAYYPLDDIIAGVAVFDGKQKVRSLPQHPNFEPGRYLLGIVRNIAQEREGLAIAESLLRLRLKHEDIWLSGIRGARDLVLLAQSKPADLVQSFLDRALHAARGVDRLFWLTSAVDTILGANGERDSLLQLAARRIHATHDAPHADRLAAFRFIAERVVPLS
jgi:hypothetical protein